MDRQEQSEWLIHVNFAVKGNLGLQLYVDSSIVFALVIWESSEKPMEDRIHDSHREDAHRCEENPAQVALNVSHQPDTVIQMGENCNK